MSTDPMFTDHDTDDDLEYTRVDNGRIVPPAPIDANPLVVLALCVAFLAALTVGLWAASAAAHAIA